jgi:ubiquinone biosynthesis protein COQ4
MATICKNCLRALWKPLARRSISSALPLASYRAFSVLNRPPPNYEGHVPLTRIERAGLAAGSALWSFFDPTRAGKIRPLFMPFHGIKLTITTSDLIAALGEATAQPYFINRLRDAMLSNPTGRRILRERPRITSKTMNVEYLRSLPENTVGRAYVSWLDREGVSPDTRDNVRYIDDEECAYVMQRYRECHDFYHALTGLPVFREGEVALKAFEFANTLLPMTGLSMAAVATLKQGERQRFFSIYGPWAIRNGMVAEEVINVFWEEELEGDVEALRTRLGIEKPPDLRAIRKTERERKKREKLEREGPQT